jgi:hypothetical protein
MEWTKTLCVMGLTLSLLCARPPATVEVEGADGTIITLTTADLAKLPQQTLKVTDHGTAAVFEGVLLSDVLAKVALPTGEKFHSTAASYYLLVEARDGYRAVFAWAELDPSFLEKTVYLALRRDGKALPDAADSFQLVAPGEKRTARSVRQVKALRIKRAAGTEGK